MLLRAVPQPTCGSMAATARPPIVGGRPLNYALGRAWEVFSIPQFTSAHLR